MTDLILPLLIFLFPLAYSPGPGNLFFASLGARSGFAQVVPALAGYHIATVIVTVALGLGFAGMVAQSEVLAQVLRYVGAAYVIWLAYRIAASPATVEMGGRHEAGFGAGALLLLLNPKAYVIIGLMFSQFLVEAGGWALVLLIALVFTLNNLLAFAVWTLVGDRIGRVFAERGAGQRLNLVFGAMLAGVAVWMALD